MRALSRPEIEELRLTVADFRDRSRAAEPFPGLIDAIPSRVAQLLIEAGWRVDDAGRWVSPRNGRATPWPDAVDQELAAAE